MLMGFQAIDLPILTPLSKFADIFSGDLNGCYDTMQSIGFKTRT